MQHSMDSLLIQIEKNVYTPCELHISAYKTDLESQIYAACQFKLNHARIIYRNSKITPKKNGQFVTFWKRDVNGITTPYDQTDALDFFVITTKTETHLGQFVFPKSILINKKILSTNLIDGKRGFRVYPIWDKPKSKQAQKTQQWQLNYFYSITTKTDINQVQKLFNHTFI